MANNRIVRYVTNTALLAVLAAAGIGVYQLGTSGTDVEIQEEAQKLLLPWLLLLLFFVFEPYRNGICVCGQLFGCSKLFDIFVNLTQCLS